ncbi:MAG: hypothetical protein Ta2G_09260 [Termitinemataceae bacterium]|nr:MAG: hypothetical protein Ta2G_09260 [Termitinemataceae bacterium]
MSFRIRALCALSFLIAIACLPAFAQDEDENEGKAPKIKTGTAKNQTGYSRGDQMFWINLGTLIPLGVTYNDKIERENNIKVGGTGSLKYSYFIFPDIFIGAELQGSFSPTLAKKFFFTIPITFHAGYQFRVWRFEFPLLVSIGGATQTYDKTEELYGLAIKAEGSVYFKCFPDWDFGVNFAYWAFPQITYIDKKRTPQYDATGHFLEITVGARYHF